jgi:hypothetical protein
MGPEAGHANWTGQSGLATKTSHAVFLISSAFQRMKAEEHSVAAADVQRQGQRPALARQAGAADDEALQTAYEEAGAASCGGRTWTTKRRSALSQSHSPTFASLLPSDLGWSRARVMKLIRARSGWPASLGRRSVTSQHRADE